MQTLASRPRRLTALGMVLVLALGTLAPSAPAADASGSISDARQQREQARAEQARAARQIDVLTAEDAQLRRALADIEEAVAAQQARVDDVQRALHEAEDEADRRRRELEQAEAALEATRSLTTELLVETYVGAHSDLVLEAMLRTSDPAEAAARRGILDALRGSRRDLLDELRSAEVVRNDALAAADDAVEATEARRAELAAALAELEERRTTQAHLSNELQRRIGDLQQRVAQLEREEAELTTLIRRRQAEALGISSSGPGAASVEGFRMPASGRVTSGFGMRRHPILGTVRLHAGVDMSGRTGDPVWASKEGRVIFAGWNGGYGNLVVVQHVGSVSTAYAHLSRILVADGDWVDGGEVIGQIGSTGLSTGPHLHFEVRVNGVPRDPQIFLP